MFKFSKKEEKEPKNLKEIIREIKSLKESFEGVSKEIEMLKEKQNLSFQKIGMIRYNPFGNVGGDQSFSLALLDENNSGFIVTSLYSRDGNRIYGKPIKNGASEYQLSEEEKRAINEAKNNDKQTGKLNS